MHQGIWQRLRSMYSKAPLRQIICFIACSVTFLSYCFSFFQNKSVDNLVLYYIDKSNHCHNCDCHGCRKSEIGIYKAVSMVYRVKVEDA